MAVPHTLPDPDGGHGCPVMTWAIVKRLRELGHQVSLFAFSPTESAREPQRENARQALKRLGVGLIEPGAAPIDPFLPLWQTRAQAIRKAVLPRAGDFFHGVLPYRDSWIETVNRQRPDALWLYTVEAAALADKTFSHIPRLVSVVDLDHEARALKRSLRSLSLRNAVRNTLEGLNDRHLPATSVQLLKGCDVVIGHALSSADWLKWRGVRAHYLPNPVESSPMPADYNSSRERLLAATPTKRILMVGHLRGVATRTGLQLLADEVLPSLVAKTGGEKWEVHIVGAGELAPDLRARLASYPQVRLRGFVEDLADEYRRAHLVLVTVNAKLGFRTRLVEAFAYGSAVVAHSNNRCGMPELIHGQNALLGETGGRLAEAIAHLLGNDLLRQSLGLLARCTYEERLSAPRVVGKMCELLMEQAGKKNAIA